MSDVNIDARQAQDIARQVVDQYNELGLTDTLLALTEYVFNSSHEGWASIDTSEVLYILVKGKRSED